jgi:hypothetical protein
MGGAGERYIIIFVAISFKLCPLIEPECTAGARKSAARFYNNTRECFFSREKDCFDAVKLTSNEE